MRILYIRCLWEAVILWQPMEKLPATRSPSWRLCGHHDFQTKTLKIVCNLAFSVVSGSDRKIADYWPVWVYDLLYRLASPPRNSLSVMETWEWVVMKAFEAATLNFHDVSSMHAASHFRGVHSCCVCHDINWVYVIGNGSIFKKEKGRAERMRQMMSNGEGCVIFQSVHIIYNDSS